MLWVMTDLQKEQFVVCEKILVLVLTDAVGKINLDTITDLQGLKKNLNSSFPLGQVALKVCLP